MKRKLSHLIASNSTIEGFIDQMNTMRFFEIVFTPLPHEKLIAHGEPVAIHSIDGKVNIFSWARSVSPEGRDEGTGFAKYRMTLGKRLRPVPVELLPPATPRLLA